MEATHDACPWSQPDAATWLSGNEALRRFTRLFRKTLDNDPRQFPLQMRAAAAMLLALFGEEPKAVSGAGGAYLTPGVEDEFRLDMEFATGARAHVFASWMHPMKEHRLVVVGSDAMVVFEDSAPEGEKLRLYRHTFDMTREPPEPKKAEPTPLPYLKDEPLRRECQHFLDCVATGGRPRTDGAEGLRVLRVLTHLTPTAATRAAVA